MSTNYNKKIKSLQQSIIDISMALEEYKRLINKNKEKFTDKYSFQHDISNPLSSIQETLGTLKNKEINLEHKDILAMIRRIKTTIENVDQVVRDAYLPTGLDKVYEAIKTVLRDLIALFAPFEGRETINAATQTLTSARSTLFSEVKNLEKSLNPPEKNSNPPEETEQFHYYRSMIAPMFG
ncbi:hypothetical protein [Rickettsiella endosymbiont of Dermanyssus gallinae]|uniref:hypothetical protein n=1 Tax=Rickettsiella endosymbiont of Dermanyssus gallinae TaxID=2856608 RepID=UPI001C533938|nr:hypothetical protein [Rickettsiella endosymbiont of Dermanyssus gallinae]